MVHKYLQYIYYEKISRIYKGQFHNSPSALFILRHQLAVSVYLWGAGAHHNGLCVCCFSDLLDNERIYLWDIGRFCRNICCQLGVYVPVFYLEFHYPRESDLRCGNDRNFRFGQYTYNETETE